MSFLEQWGTFTESASTVDYRYFPITFPTDCIFAVGGNSFISDGNGVWANVVDNSSFLCGIASNLGGGGTSYYMFLGY